MKQKKHLVNAAKLLVGALLVGYVLKSKMIDFHSVRSVLFDPFNLVFCFVFLSFATLCCSMRWYLLARAQGLTLTYRDMFSLTMIGSFFNTVMPGAVGGDLIKAWYIAGRAPEKKGRAIFSVVVDRLVGLSVIFFYAAGMFLFYTQWISTRPQLYSLAVSVWIFGLLTVVGLVFFLSSRLWGNPLWQKGLGVLKRSESLERMIRAIESYREARRYLIGAIALSLISIFSGIVLFYWFGRQLGISLSLSDYVIIVPLGQIVSAIPLLPGGMGVGQVAFYKFFDWLGASPEQGATLATLMQVYTVFFNCLGAFFYFRYRSAPKQGMTLEPTSEEKSSAYLLRNSGLTPSEA